MKKVLFSVMVLAAVVAFSGVSFASLKSNTGCGFGTQIWAGHDGLIPQLSAMTTNGITTNQWMGISSGTLGCEKFRGIVFNSKVDSFIASNMESLANDMAKGQGEYLDTLATLLEVNAADRLAFNAALQSNFSNIYTSEAVTSDEVKINIEKVLNS